MNRSNNKNVPQRTLMELPKGFIAEEQALPIVFIELGEMNIGEADTQKKINEAIYRALCRIHSAPISGQTLVKVHIGEPQCSTRMKPEYTESSVRFLRDAGASGIVSGDTTVAYSGSRGHKQNPVGDASAYLELAQRHGWSEEGPTGIPFVIMDRPSTSKPGYFEFSEEEKRIEIKGIQRFKDFFIAGGVASADFIINHAHLTLHGLAGIAGCVKSIAMGCSSLKGKLRMHQSLLPHFDNELCESCGQCVDNCPENALELNRENLCPVVNPDLCIGCGECEAICEKRAVTIRGEDITAWERGKDTLPLRMANYTIGLMNSRWEKTIHVLHMYSITEYCDCLNIRQNPMLKRDIGFLISKNPFVVDKLAGRMLVDSLRKEGRKADESLLKTAQIAANYVKETYGIVCDEALKKEAIR